MKNSRGVVLALTLLFILVFTIFGFTAIYFSGLQKQAIAKQVFSTQAFWLAEAGIHRAMVNLPVMYPENSPLVSPLGEGAYSVTSDHYVGTDPTTGQPYTYEYVWKVDSTGTVSKQPRKIEVVVSGFGHFGALNAKGDVYIGSSSDVTGEIYAGDQIEVKKGDGTYYEGDPTMQNMEANMNKILGFDSLALLYDHIANKANVEHDPNFYIYPTLDDIPDIGNKHNMVRGITWVESGYTGGDGIEINSDPANPAILIVNGGVSRLKNGTLFYGILLVNGDLDRSNGGGEINGETFVIGNYGDENGHGNSQFIFDSSNPIFVDKALRILFNNSPQVFEEPAILTWKEIN